MTFIQLTAWIHVIFMLFCHFLRPVCFYGVSFRGESRNWTLEFQVLFCPPLAAAAAGRDWDTYEPLILQLYAWMQTLHPSMYLRLETHPPVPLSSPTVMLMMTFIPNGERNGIEKEHWNGIKCYPEEKECTRWSRGYFVHSIMKFLCLSLWDVQPTRFFYPSWVWSA